MAGRVVLVLAVLVLAGCRLGADVDLHLDRNGGGELVVRIEMDAELAAAAEEAGLDAFQSVVAAADANAAWRSERTESGIVISTRFDDPAALQARSRELASGLDAAELQPLQPLSVIVTDDRLEVTGQASLQPTTAVAELGLTQRDAVAALSDSVDYTVTVQMPGEVIEVSPGASITERTVTWNIPAGEILPVRVVARRPPRWALWMWVTGAVAVSALAAAVLAVLSLRRRTTPRP